MTRHRAFFYDRAGELFREQVVPKAYPVYEFAVPGDLGTFLADQDFMQECGIDTTFLLGPLRTRKFWLKRNDGMALMYEEEQ